MTCLCYVILYFLLLCFSISLLYFGFLLFPHSWPLYMILPFLLLSSECESLCLSCYCVIVYVIVILRYCYCYWWCYILLIIINKISLIIIIIKYIIFSRYGRRFLFYCEHSLFARLDSFRTSFSLRSFGGWSHSLHPRREPHIIS